MLVNQSPGLRTNGMSTSMKNRLFTWFLVATLYLVDTEYSTNQEEIWHLETGL
jgi:hypothetical protein